MDNVIQIHPVEMIFVDPGHLVELARKRGRPHAEFVAHSALEEIAERLTAADVAWRAGEFRRLARISRLIVGMSEELGMVTLGSVSGLVSHAAATSDHTALGALIARLDRVGGASLEAFWEFGHLRL